MLVITSYGAPLTIEVVLSALFAFPISILIGTLSFLPLGLANASRPCGIKAAPAPAESALPHARS
jgi:hypothetical protein